MNSRLKIMIIFGTRPEAIKMCPVVNELKKRSDKFDVTVCVTGQHKEMLTQVLNAFKIEPDINLNIMKEKQSLFDVSIAILQRIQKVIEDVKPNTILVHGDTTTAAIAALSSFYYKIPICHIEAGLRTYDLESPFPEEFNRQFVGIIAKYHFAPTINAKNNLLKEGKNEDDIFVTGNTGIDALRTTVKKNFIHEYLDWAGNSRLIIMTVHRRENLGKPMKEIFSAIRKVVDEENVKIIFPVHKNPIIREIAELEFDNCDKIKLVEPIDVIEFHNLVAKSYIILTDSGGIQEEAPSLGKPVLVLRNKTERPEGVEAGTLRLIGTEYNNVYNNIMLLLKNKDEYEKMSKSSNPYGNGHSSETIAGILENLFKDKL